MNIFFLMATFTAPQEIGTDPVSMLWLLPLSAAIAIVYKTTKLPKITFWELVKEAGLLFLSIVVFISIAAAVLWAIMRLVTE